MGQQNTVCKNSNLQYKDGVSSIILGFNDWAKAWALDNNNLPLFLLCLVEKGKDYLIDLELI